MSAEETNNTASQQREESNFLSRQILAVGKQLRIMAVIGIVTAIGIGIQDHFLLHDTSKIALVTVGRMDVLEKSFVTVPKAGAFWSYGMMLDWVKQLGASNSGLSTPSARDIHETHAEDLQGGRL